MNVSTQRNRIIPDLMSAPKGLMHLNGESLEGMLATFRDYGRRAAADGKIIFTRVQQKQLISLKDWVKDRNRLQEDIAFDTDATRVALIAESKLHRNTRNIGPTKRRLANP